MLEKLNEGFPYKGYQIVDKINEVIEFVNEHSVMIISHGHPDPIGEKGAKGIVEDYPMPEDTVLFNKGVAEGRRLEREENYGVATLDIYNTAFAKGKEEAKKEMWKPSEEQMKALNVLNLHGDLPYVGQQNQLISLYNDLKKLM